MSDYPRLETTPPNEEKRPGYVNCATLAKLFNRSERRISQLAKGGIIPYGEGGQYPLAASVQGFVKYLDSLSEKGQSKLGKVKLAREQAKLRRETVEADQAESHVVEKDVVQRVLSRATLTIKQRAFAFARTGSSKGAMKLGLSNEQAQVMQESVENDLRNAFDELSKTIFGKTECPSCKTKF